jgi:branched-chain amino acid transport system ATP-binding protein
MSEVLLNVSELSVAYGAIRALHAISFEVRAGQVVSLIGANGAGKSTTLNAISGLQKPQSGTVRFEGVDITGWRADRVTARGVVQVPEGRQVIAPLSVLENLMMGAYLQRDADTRRDLEVIFERFPRLAERRNQ